MGSSLDVGVLTRQMHDFFAEGAGREAFGDWQTLAVDVCREMRAEMARVGQAAAQQDSFPEAAALVASWCAENPLDRTKIYARDLPKLATWQAELAVSLPV
jgi:hypothetical protein